jgi:hypothetical protein
LDFFIIRCPLEVLSLIILPVPVILNRFAAAFLVFILGIYLILSRRLNLGKGDENEALGVLRLNFGLP